MKNWLPQNYNVPKASGGNYMKLEEGANKFRVLSAPIMGYLYWSNEKKPVRLVEHPGIMPSNIQPDGKIKHFWAFVVWSYRDSRVQILEITQSSIQEAITDLLNGEDWGNPEDFDLTITRKGEGLDTEYSVQPSAPKARPVEAVAAITGMQIDLNELFHGGDPFAPKNSDGSEIPFN